MKNIFIYILLTIGAFVLMINLYFFAITNQFENKYVNSQNNLPFVKSFIKHDTIVRQDLTIHYFVSGQDSNDAILFLNPAYADHRCFNSQIDHFSKNFKVITMDLAGHGLSQVEKSELGIESSSLIIQNMMQKENVSKLHIVGVSLGSLIAQDFAYAFPENVITLTAVGGYDIANSKVKKELTKSIQRNELFKLLFRAAFSMPAFRSYVSEGTVVTDHARGNMYHILETFTRSSFKAMRKFESLTTAPRSSGLQLPLLIINGEKEKEPIALELSKNWHESNIGSEFVLIPGAGHCANMDKPEEFNKILEDFLKRKQPAE